jgi:hypothetical protein
VQPDRHCPRQLDEGARHPQPHRGRGRARGVGVRGLTTQTLRGRSQPARAGLGLGALGSGGQHGDQALLGHLATRRGHARIADEGTPTDPGIGDAQPPTAQLVGRDEGVIGQEGALADIGEPRDEEHRGGLDVRADPRAQRTQPHRGHRRGVDREEPRAGLVEDPQRRPGLPRLTRVHGVRALGQPESEESDDEEHEGREHEETHCRRDGQPEQGAAEENTQGWRVGERPRNGGDARERRDKGETGEREGGHGIPDHPGGTARWRLVRPRPAGRPTCGGRRSRPSFVVGRNIAENR